jgi:hypothetical protein
MSDEAEPKQYDPLKVLCAMLNVNKMGFVFWVCDNPEHRGVTWKHGEHESIATCDVCGKQSVPQHPKGEL